MDELREICERLLRDSNARSIVLSARDGQNLARAGDTMPGDIVAKIQAEGERAAPFRVAEPTHLHVSGVGEHAILVVLFGNETSLGLVRLRVKKATQDLNRALARGPSGDGGASGAAALLDD